MRQIKANRGFSRAESAIVLVFVVAMAFVIYFVGWDATESARKQTMKTDINTVQKSVDAYYFSSGLAGRPKWPTIDGKLPTGGGDIPIYFDASFISRGEEHKFCPDSLKRLPRHWDEEVWRINGGGKVSIDIDPDEY